MDVLPPHLRLLDGSMFDSRGLCPKPQWAETRRWGMPRAQAQGQHGAGPELGQKGGRAVSGQERSGDKLLSQVHLTWPLAASQSHGLGGQSP